MISCICDWVCDWLNAINDFTSNIIIDLFQSWVTKNRFQNVFWTLLVCFEVGPLLLLSLEMGTIEHCEPSMHAVVDVFQCFVRLHVMTHCRPYGWVASVVSDNTTRTVELSQRNIPIILPRAGNMKYSSRLIFTYPLEEH